MSVCFVLTTPLEHIENNMGYLSQAVGCHLYLFVRGNPLYFSISNRIKHISMVLDIHVVGWNMVATHHRMGLLIIHLIL